MIFPKTLRWPQLHTSFKIQNPSLYFGRLNPKIHTDNSKTYSISSIYQKPFLPSSTFHRPISVAAQFALEIDSKKDDVEKSIKKPKNPLYSLFKESNEKPKQPPEVHFKDAVGLSNKLQESDKKRLRQLEMELTREIERSQKEIKTLSGLFASNDQTSRLRKESRKLEEEGNDFKELSPDMAIFANYLYRKGYLMNANFLPNNKFDVSCFERNYGRDFLKFAAEEFAKDHREIGRWLSDSDLKKVARFGCPSLGRKNVFSTKLLRAFYGIQEQTVCSKCVLRESCKFANQTVWQKGPKNMDFTVVMRVITLYALEAGPPQLEVPDDIKNTVNRLFKEIIRLNKADS